MPIEQVRSFLLIALAVVVFLMWQAWQQDYGAKPPPERAAAPEQTQRQAPGDVPDQPRQPPGDGQPAQPGAQRAAAPADVPDIPRTPGAEEAQEPARPAAPAARVPRVRVRTDVLAVEIDPEGGDLRRAELLQHPVDPEQPDKPVSLLSDTRPNLFISQSGLLGSRTAPNHYTAFTPEKTDYRLSAGEDRLEVKLRWQSPEGVGVTKIYTFERDSYAIQVSHRIENGSDAPWSGRMYGQLQRTQPPGASGLFRIYTYTGGVLSTKDKPYEKIDFDDMAEQPLGRDTQGGWAAMIQHYFAGAWIPDQDALNHYYTKALEGGRYVIGVISPERTVAAGASDQLGMRLYVGPKIQDRLGALAPHLERTVDYGWLWFLSEPLFWLLDKIHSFVGNWGWSIVLLTVLIKLAFFHLSATSYKSMARMRRLQPRMLAIRERYGSDKQRMNQAMMQLYKEEKVNPLSSCLPILVQIPVFIALYWVLIESVELRHADFMLWINDLSSNDPYFVLPILMGVTMFLQQKLNPTPPDPMQARIMMALPFVFTFFFLFFPAGLVLYWLVNNILSILQQWVITRRIAPQTT